MKNQKGLKIIKQSIDAKINCIIEVLDRFVIVIIIVATIINVINLFCIGFFVNLLNLKNKHAKKTIYNCAPILSLSKASVAKRAL